MWRHLSESVFLLMLATVCLAQDHYSVEWDRPYGSAQFACGIESAILGGDGDIWLLCEGHDYAVDQQFLRLYRIDGSSGDLKFVRDLHLNLPVPAAAFEQRHFISRIGASSIGVFTNTASGGRDQTREGSFLTLLTPEGLPTKAVPIIPREQSGIHEVRHTRDENVIIAADQAPMILRKLDQNGRIVWSQEFSSQYVLPTLGISPTDSLCVTAQISGKNDAAYLELIQLDRAGRVTNRVRIQAAQGLAVVRPGGGCAVLYIPEFGSAQRHFALYDSALKRQSDERAPFNASGGRTFSMEVQPDGYLAMEPSARPPVMAKFSLAGQLAWQDALPSGFKIFLRGPNAAYFLSVNFLKYTESFRILKVQFK